MSYPDILLWQFVLASVVTLFAGFTKGVTGFALPLIMVSGMASFLPADLVIATMVIPTLLSNFYQAMRQGWREAWESLCKYRLLIVTTLITIFICAQWVRLLPVDALFILLGSVIVITSAIQLSGVNFRISKTKESLGAFITGLIAGFFGSISGTWGPPIVIYLLGIDTPKIEQVRVTGVAFGLGALMLLVAHGASGFLTAEAIGLSLTLLPAMIVGMWLGGLALDKIDAKRFRKTVLIVLLIAGLNILRRAVGM